MAYADLDFVSFYNNTKTSQRHNIEICKNHNGNEHFNQLFEESKQLQNISCNLMHVPFYWVVV